jgi:hypothetical protein
MHKIRQKIEKCIPNLKVACSIKYLPLELLKMCVVLVTWQTCLDSFIYHETLEMPWKVYMSNLSGY